MRIARVCRLTSAVTFCMALLLAAPSTALADLNCGQINAHSGACNWGGFTANFPNDFDCSDDNDQCAQEVCQYICEEDESYVGSCQSNQYSSWFWFRCEVPI